MMRAAAVYDARDEIWSEKHRRLSSERGVDTTAPRVRRHALSRVPTRGMRARIPRSIMGCERIPFGRTGHDSTRVIFGAAALGAMRQDRADRVLELLLESGIDHIDTAASYG